MRQRTPARPLNAFGQALEAALEQNEQDGREPSSLRALARKLAPGTNGETKRRTLRRYMIGERMPSYAVVTEIERAVGLSEGALAISEQERLRLRESRLAEENRRLRALLNGASDEAQNA
ncbi:hypothetical protein [Gaiella occulta]|uniref:hypothetical protein n=1 Tax=Gaiella occulta TaxID=1002870 RepID=UPI0011C023B1|nr:hypothetical protein [Gaiella occulta]